MEKDIYNLLDNLKNGIREDFNIYVGVEEYKDIVKLGRNEKEKLQLLIMCYVNNPTIEELNNWTLNDLLEYIKETDDEEFYEQDMVEIRKCIKIIEKGTDVFELEFEDELVKILNKYDKSWIKEPLNSDEVEVLIGHLRNQLDLINGNITNDEYLKMEG